MLAMRHQDPITVHLAQSLELIAGRLLRKEKERIARFIPLPHLEVKAGL
jgi:hypothetical protein